MKYIRFMRTWFFKKAVNYRFLMALAYLMLIVFFKVIVDMSLEGKNTIIEWFVLLLTDVAVIFFVYKLFYSIKNDFIMPLKRFLALFDEDEIKSLYGKAPERSFVDFYCTEKLLCSPTSCFFVKYSDIESVKLTVEEEYVSQDSPPVSDGYFGNLIFKIKDGKEDFTVVIKKGMCIKSMFQDFTEFIEKKKSQM